MVGEIMSIQIGTFAQSTNIYVEFYDFSLYSFEVCVCVSESPAMKMWSIRIGMMILHKRLDNFKCQIASACAPYDFKTINKMKFQRRV